MTIEQAIETMMAKVTDSRVALTINDQASRMVLMGKSGESAAPFSSTELIEIGTAIQKRISAYLRSDQVVCGF